MKRCETMFLKIKPVIFSDKPKVMKNFITPILFLVLNSCVAQDSTPYGLMVEFLRSPEFIELREAQPDFSWIVPAGCEKQTAYQIQAASSKNLLNQNSPNYWDSGKITNNQSINIEYEGEPLLGNSTYYWRVKIWDANDNSSKYSVIQQFKTGSLNNYTTTSNSFLVEHRTPVLIKEKSKGHYFVDFGKDAFGTIVLDIQPTKKETIIIHLGEKISKPFQLDDSPEGSIRYQKLKLKVDPGQSKYTLALPSDKRNTNTKAVLLPDSIGVITPFRYCELENVNFEFDADNISHQAVSYFFDDNESYFTCSDKVLNQVWEMCKYSMKATSFCGVYVDGDRERIPYEADAFINQLGHYCTDREYSMARLTNDYFMEKPTWPTEWILFTPLLFYYDYLYTGNTEAIKYHWEKLKYKTLTDLAREDGLINTSKENQTEELIVNLGFKDPTMRIRDIVDWPPAQKDTGWELATEEGERDGYEFKEINTVVNAFHYYSIKLMAGMARAIGHEEDAHFYEVRSKKVKTAFNDRLLDPAKGYYIDGEGSTHSSLHANMFALAFGLAPEKHMKSIVKFIKSRGMACSVYGSQFLLDGLYLAGESEYAFELMTALHDRSWWNMIASGSTISMEAWDMKYKPNSDWNHAWGAAPANIIPRHLWGIQPTLPGFEECTIKPQMSQLTSSKIKVPTIRGSIFGEYKKDENKGTFTIEIPGNMGAKFNCSSLHYKEVRLNGRQINVSNGLILLSSGGNKLEFFY